MGNKFISRNIKQIKSGGLPILVNKVKILLIMIYRYLLLSVVLILFSAPLILIVSCVKSFVLIRWKELSVRRLGDFAGDTELYLCEKEMHQLSNDYKIIDIFYTLYCPCNKTLFIMYKRELRVVPKCFGIIFHGSSIIINKCTFLPSLANHIVPPNAHGHRDVKNLLDITTPHLKFTNHELQKGIAWLKCHNIPTNSKIVLLFVRDDAYLKIENTVFGNSNWDYHNYRDCDIDNFVLVSEKLAKLGYYVIRMGFHVNKPLLSTHPFVIDYAYNGMRDDFIDIYLPSICSFIISTTHGAEAPSSWCFRKPRVMVNQAPLGIAQTWSNKDIFITKHHISRVTNQELTLSQIKNKVGFCHNTKCFEDHGILLKENTPNEICEVTMEMVSRLDGNWQHQSDDENNQHRFWNIFPTYSVNSIGSPFHGEIKASFGANYLRNNQSWLR